MTSKTDDLVKQLRETADVWEHCPLKDIAYQAADALEAAGKQARADEEAMREVDDLLLQVFQLPKGNRIRAPLRERLKAREGERKGDD